MDTDSQIETTPVPASTEDEEQPKATSRSLSRKSIKSKQSSSKALLLDSKSPSQIQLKTQSNSRQSRAQTNNSKPSFSKQTSTKSESGFSTKRKSKSSKIELEDQETTPAVESDSQQSAVVPADLPDEEKNDVSPAVEDQNTSIANIAETESQQRANSQEEASTDLGSTTTISKSKSGLAKRKKSKKSKTALNSTDLISQSEQGSSQEISSESAEDGNGSNETLDRRTSKSKGTLKKKSSKKSSKFLSSSEQLIEKEQQNENPSAEVAKDEIQTENIVSETAPEESQTIQSQPEEESAAQTEQGAQSEPEQEPEEKAESSVNLVEQPKTKENSFIIPESNESESNNPPEDVPSTNDNNTPENPIIEEPAVDAIVDDANVDISVEEPRVQPANNDGGGLKPLTINTNLTKELLELANAKFEDIEDNDLITQAVREVPVVWFKCFLKNQTRIIIADQHIDFVDFGTQVSEAFFGLCTSCNGGVEGRHLFGKNNYGRRVLGDENSILLKYPDADGNVFPLETSKDLDLAISMSHELHRAFVPIFCTVVGPEGEEVADMLTPFATQMKKDAISLLDLIAARHEELEIDDEPTEANMRTWSSQYVVERPSQIQAEGKVEEEPVQKQESVLEADAERAPDHIAFEETSHADNEEKQVEDTTAQEDIPVSPPTDVANDNSEAAPTLENQVFDKESSSQELQQNISKVPSQVLQEPLPDFQDAPVHEGETEQISTEEPVEDPSNEIGNNESSDEVSIEPGNAETTVEPSQQVENENTAPQSAGISQQDEPTLPDVVEVQVVESAGQAQSENISTEVPLEPEKEVEEISDIPNESVPPIRAASTISQPISKMTTPKKSVTIPKPGFLSKKASTVGSEGQGLSKQASFVSQPHELISEEVEVIENEQRPLESIQEPLEFEVKVAASVAAPKKQPIKKAPVKKNIPKKSVPFKSSKLVSSANIDTPQESKPPSTRSNVVLRTSSTIPRTSKSQGTPAFLTEAVSSMSSIKPSGAKTTDCVPTGTHTSVSQFDDEAEYRIYGGTYGEAYSEGYSTAQQEYYWGYDNTTYNFGTLSGIDPSKIKANPYIEKARALDRETVEPTPVGVKPADNGDIAKGWNKSILIKRGKLYSPSIFSNVQDKGKMEAMRRYKRELARQRRAEIFQRPPPVNQRIEMVHYVRMPSERQRNDRKIEDIVDSEIDKRLHRSRAAPQKPVNHNQVKQQASLYSSKAINEIQQRKLRAEIDRRIKAHQANLDAIGKKVDDETQTSHPDINSPSIGTPAPHQKQHIQQSTRESTVSQKPVATQIDRLKRSSVGNGYSEAGDFLRAKGHQAGIVRQGMSASEMDTNTDAYDTVTTDYPSTAPYQPPPMDKIRYEQKYLQRNAIKTHQDKIKDSIKTGSKIPSIHYKGRSYDDPSYYSKAQQQGDSDYYDVPRKSSAGPQRRSIRQQQRPLSPYAEEEPTTQENMRYNPQHVRRPQVESSEYDTSTVVDPLLENLTKLGLQSLYPNALSVLEEGQKKKTSKKSVRMQPSNRGPAISESDVQQQQTVRNGAKQRPQVQEQQDRRVEKRSKQQAQDYPVHSITLMQVPPNNSNGQIQIPPMQQIAPVTTTHTLPQQQHQLNPYGVIPPAGPSAFIEAVNPVNGEKMTYTVIPTATTNSRSILNETYPQFQRMQAPQQQMFGNNRKEGYLNRRLSQVQQQQQHSNAQSSSIPSFTIQPQMRTFMQPPIQQQQQQQIPPLPQNLQQVFGVYPMYGGSYYDAYQQVFNNAMMDNQGGGINYKTSNGKKRVVGAKIDSNLNNSRKIGGNSEKQRNYESTRVFF